MKVPDPVVFSPTLHSDHLALLRTHYEIQRLTQKPDRDMALPTRGHVRSACTALGAVVEIQVYWVVKVACKLLGFFLRKGVPGND